MHQTDNDFSTHRVTPALISQIVDALKNKAFGSVEIYIQNYRVVQITERTITKVHQPFAARRKTTIESTNRLNRNSEEIESSLVNPNS